jgi:hypothetical protein
MHISIISFAQTTSTPRIDQRQENQAKRIDQGVKSGELTPKEAARLKKGQEDRQSRRIYKEKHDAQTTK